MRPLVIAALLAATIASAAHAGPPARLREFLRESVKFTDAEFASVEKGGVVTRLLPGTDEGEIAAFGIVRVEAGAVAFEKLANDPARYRAMEGMDQVGRFSDPPAAADVAALIIPSDDIDALKKCKPGSCDVKLTDESLVRVMAIDWRSADAKAQAARSLKEMMVALAAGYRSGGVATLGTMVDKKQPKSRVDEFHRLLQNSPYLYKYVADFSRYVEGYPAGSFPGAATTLFWTKDTFSPKPTISVCAVTVARVDNHALMAHRLLAASHFFNAGLDVAVAVPAGDGPGCYVVDVYRVRIDPPTGMLAGPAMKRVQDGIEKGVEKTLSGIRSKLQ